MKCDWEKGKLYQESKNWSDALNCYLPYYEELIIRKDFNKLKTIAWCYSCNRDYSLSIEVLKEMLKIKPCNGIAMNMMAYQYYSLKRWEEAITYYREVLKLIPNFHESKFKLAYSLVMSINSERLLSHKEFYKAIDLYSEIIEDLESIENLERKKLKVFEKSLYQRSKLNLRRMDYTGAIEDIEKAIQINSKDQNYYYTYSKSLILNKNFKKASIIAKKIKKPNLYNHVMYKIEEENNPEKAMTYLERIDKPYTKVIKLELLLRMEKYEELVRCAFRIKKLVNKNQLHKYYYLLSKALLELELFKKSKEYLLLACEEKKKNYSGDYIEAIELIDEKLHLDKTIEDENKVLKTICIYDEDVYKISTINNYNSSRSFGFIDYSPENVFFHKSSLDFDETSIKRGLKVSFCVKKSDKNSGRFKAKNIKICED